MEGANLMEALWYSALPLQLFGTNPIALARTDRGIFYRVSVLGVIYVLLLVGVVAVSAYVCNLVLPEVFEWNDLAILRMHTQIRALIGPLCGLVVLLSSIFTASTACRVMAGLSDFVTALPHQFTSLHYRWIICYTAALLLFLLVFLPLTAYFEIINIEHITHNKLESWSFVAFFVSWVCFDIFTWAVLAQLLVFTSILYFQFRALEIELMGDLYKLISVPSVRHTVRVVAKDAAAIGIPKNVRHLRHLHIHLTCVAEDVNKLFATRILFIINLDTVLLCFCCYILILNLDQQQQAPPIGTAIPWLLNRVVPITVAILPFCCIRTKVHGISTVVHQWITKVDNDAITEQLLLFATQLNNRKLRFSAHEFFNLEASTIASIASSAVSYLVILVQFHILFNDKKGTDESLLSTSPGNSSLYNVTSYSAFE